MTRIVYQTVTTDVYCCGGFSHVMDLVDLMLVIHTFWKDKLVS